LAHSYYFNRPNFILASFSFSPYSGRPGLGFTFGLVSLFLFGLAYLVIFFLAWLGLVWPGLAWLTAVDIVVASIIGLKDLLNRLYRATV
jgi:hypothetical protein